MKTLCFLLDEHRREYLFYSTMLKPYHRPHLSIKDFSNHTDNYPNTDMLTHLVKVVYDEHYLRFRKIRQKEYDGILKKDGVTPSLRYQLPFDANVICNVFVLTIKELDTTNPIYKAR